MVVSVNPSEWFAERLVNFLLGSSVQGNGVGLRPMWW